MFFEIRETLVETDAETCLASGAPYVACLTPDQWAQRKASFNMGIDIDMELEHPHVTKAEVNYDSLTGSFSIPNRRDLTGPRFEFAFALDERGVAFIDSDARCLALVRAVQASKKWRAPSLERFLYDFLEQIISGDLALLERYDARLNALEEQVLGGRENGVIAEINQMRGELLDLRAHYEQLVDISQELEENENNFFSPGSLRYFHLFGDRVTRLQGTLTSLREYTIQVRDLYQSQLDIRQNRVMTVLTVVTTIFLPLTLIVGWYGMNFKWMPELESPLAYPIVIAACAAIVCVCLAFFKKKKLL